MKKIKYLLIALCALAVAGCDDFLTTPPLDQIVEEDWWKNAEQTQMMVDECYSKIYNDNENNLIAFRDAYTDNGIWSNNNSMGDGSMTAFTGGVKNEWKYEDIARMNYVLGGVEKAKDYVSADKYAHLKAEVRFLRAFIYYDMMFYFGDIPLVTKLLTIEESRQTSRQPRSEVLSFILKELQESLEDIKKAPNEESGRVNEDVINAFLARIYLHEGDYNKVLTHTEAVMKTGKYALYRAFEGVEGKSSYEELFRPQADGNNQEVIFEKQYYAPLKVHSLNRNLSYPSSVYKGWKGVMPLQNMVDEYECIEGHPYSECEKLGCKYVEKRAEISAKGLLSYGEYEYRDPRLKATIITPGWEWKVNGKTTSVYGIEDKNSKDHISKEANSTGFLVTKWVDLEGEEADRVRGGKNLTIIRYADILLMRAEALIEKNERLDEAASLINEIRGRAGMPQNVVVSSQSEMREKLRHERRVEFAFEGLRYYDIIRWRICDKVKNGDVYGFAKMDEKRVSAKIFLWKSVSGKTTCTFGPYLKMQET